MTQCPYCGLSKRICFSLTTCELLRKQTTGRSSRFLEPIHLFGVEFLFQREVDMSFDLGRPRKRSVWASPDQSRYLIQENGKEWYYLLREGSTWFMIQTKMIEDLRTRVLATPVLLLNPQLTDDGLLDVEHLSLS
jgi:hypothetical protein